MIYFSYKELIYAKTITKFHIKRHLGNKNVSKIWEKINQLNYLKIVSPLLIICLKLLPYAVIWILFSLLYIFMPNNHVKLKSGIIAGILAGTFFQFIQWGSIIIQINISQYNAIYGSFAALPFLLIWIQFSWSIVLFGAEISYAHQNANEFENSLGCLNINDHQKKHLYILIMTILIKAFANGTKPLSANNVAKLVGVPLRLAQQLLLKLHEAKLIFEVKQNKTNDVLYQPTRDINAYTIHYVLSALDDAGNHTLKIMDSTEMVSLKKHMSKLNETMIKSRANVLLKDL
ncbi:MAG: hypothetical protein A2Y40_09210 [Candidatus Margulisbacteria bacterium GWF2_35_9]|nr:MAG: hypothetical protein A2Y40_09210 [Candidatus Margulisbacteria bacterium GWF2_35_9]